MNNDDNKSEISGAGAPTSQDVIVWWFRREPLRTLLHSVPMMLYNILPNTFARDQFQGSSGAAGVSEESFAYRAPSFPGNLQLHLTVASTGGKREQQAQSRDDKIFYRCSY